MADTVTSTVLEDGPRNYVVQLQNNSDGTGESAVTKVDISTLTGPGPNDANPSYFAVKSIDYSVWGMNFVQLLFDATTDDELAILRGQGYVPYDPPLNDPTSSGTTGDIKLTTDGAVDGGGYNIVLHLIKKQ